MYTKLFTNICEQTLLPITRSRETNIKLLVLVQSQQKRLLRNYKTSENPDSILKTNLTSECHSTFNYRAQTKILPINSIRNKSSTMTSYALHIFETETEKQDSLKSIAKANWLRVKEKDSITKTFTFRNFVQAFSFMTAIALEAEKIDHHPEWSNVYNRVEITLTSHFCNGVSHLDIKMARNIDTLYANSPKD